ncbi:MAG: biotin transporter BioY [bacterium]
MSKEKTELPPVSKLHFYLLSSLFASLTAVGAYIKIPLPYVPITLQTFFVILGGAFLGPYFGTLSQVIYLAAGLMGAPIFAYGGGPGYILQPTFGYLLGYPVAAYIVGVLVQKRNQSIKVKKTTFVHVCVYGFIGVFFILLVGGIVLFFNLKYLVHKPISFSKLVVSYFLIFIPGDVLKAIFCSVVYLKLLKLGYPVNRRIS